MKKITLLVMLFVVYGCAHAQKAQNVYFLKNNGKEVIKDSADFVRIIQEPDSGVFNFTLMEYHMNGKLRALGSVSRFDPVLVYEEQLIRYDKNGVKQSLTNYNRGKVVDKAYEFYGNGKTKKVLEGEKIMYFADSLGNVLLNDGTGHYKEKGENHYGAYVEEGDYLNGEKDGIWTLITTAGNYSYKEKYLKGKFVSGESIKDGQSYLYAVLGEIPSYKGGIDAFYNYVSNRMAYPDDAQMNNISGKVILSFIVGIDGKVSDIKVERGVYPSLDQEAIRVVKASNGWIPGKQRGVPVRVKFNVPVNFNLVRQ